MPRLTGVYCCGDCGTETPCGWDDLNVGSVFQCPKCKQVCGHVVPKSGGRAWVKISDDDVAFYGLLNEPEPEEI
jgi:DNA-directed RNA polymerase subunit RPC12/RpoP